MELIEQIATAMEGFDKDDGVRAAVLCAQGKSFCAGANFNDPNRQGEAAFSSVGGKPVSHLYQQAVRLLRALKSQSWRRCMALQ
jgi:enoyl-CoA hydratase/carnithine racemase